MMNKIEHVLDNIKSVCNLTGDVKVHTDSGFAVHYIIDEGLVQSWVSSIQSTLINRIKQAMSVDPICVHNNALEFKYGGKMYNFSIVDCFDGDDRAIVVVGAVI